MSRPTPPHAPATGLMRRVLGDFHVTGVFWYRFLHWGVSVLPDWGIAVIVAVFTSFFFVLLFNIRRAIASNLEAALGPCGWLEKQLRIYRTMWHFAWCLSERYESVATTRKVGFSITGDELWQRALAPGKGLILLTAHIGSWELGSMLPSSHVDRVVHIVREKELDPKAQEFISKLIAEQACDRFKVHFVDDEDASFGAQLLAALRNGEIVALQGDRPRSVGKTTAVTLFDRPLDLPAGPAALARAAGVPLLPVFIFRRGRHASEVVFRSLVEVERSSDRDRDLARAMKEVASQLEWAIRQHPHQWFCFHELWPG